VIKLLDACMFVSNLILHSVEKSLNARGFAVNVELLTVTILIVATGFIRSRILISLLL
jgi:hypothetical protein